MIDDRATRPITNHIAMGETASTRDDRQPFASLTCTPGVLSRRPDVGSGGEQTDRVVSPQPAGAARVMAER